jgi:DHA2 family metal-tetracycline-proton antiporter-like MFS transporter
MENYNRKHVGKKLIRVLMFTLVISAMSVLMFNFVLPEISKEFKLTTAQVSWVTSSYALIYGIGTVIYGKLADRFRLKNLLTIGLLFFAFGSLIGLASQAFWVVLVARCLQSAGAAAIPATAMLIPLRYFPPDQRGSAMSTVFVGLAIGSALGPIISALIVSVAHWRWLFCIPLFSLLTVPFYRQYLKNEDEEQSGKFDWVGGCLLAMVIAFLLLGVTNGSWLFPIFGLLALVLFIVRIRSVSEPFVQPRIFINKNYTLRILIAFLISGIGFSLQFLSPLLLAHVQQLQPSLIGCAMVPAAVASAVLGRVGGKLADLREIRIYFMLHLSCY